MKIKPIKGYVYKENLKPWKKHNYAFFVYKKGDPGFVECLITPVTRTKKKKS